MESAGSPWSVAYIKFTKGSIETTHCWIQPKPNIPQFLEVGLCLDIIAKPPDDSEW